MPRAKLTSFNAARRALSDGVSNITINEINETFRFLKPIKEGFMRYSIERFALRLVPRAKPIAFDSV